MSKTAELRMLHGVRNDVALERFDRDAQGRRTGFTDLASAVNLDLDETGKVSRRLGTNLVVAGNAHSLFEAGDDNYVVLNSFINHVSKTLARTPVTPVNGRVAYAKINGSTYWSDGVIKGVLTGAVNVPWGIAVPTVPTAAPCLGNLRPGRYLYTMTYVRSTGAESGAPKYGEIEVLENQGISLTLPVSTDPQVATKRIYLTDCNGEVAYLAGTLTNSETTLTVNSMPVLGMPVRTQFMGPMPAGRVVGVFAGRSYVASGRYLWYSLPYEYELCDLRSGFVGFSSDVRTFAPCSNGVFVGSDTETVWLAGKDPLTWDLTTVAAYGTVLGTEVIVPGVQVGDGSANGKVAAWMSTKGLCLGFDGGQMQNVTGGRYIPPEAREGASLLKIRGGTPQVVTTLFK
jgi:hypothetical protein